MGDDGDGDGDYDWGAEWWWCSTRLDLVAVFSVAGSDAVPLAPCHAAAAAALLANIFSRIASHFPSLSMSDDRHHLPQQPYSKNDSIFQLLSKHFLDFFAF